MPLQSYSVAFSVMRISLKSMSILFHNLYAKHVGGDGVTALDAHERSFLSSVDKSCCHDSAFQLIGRGRCF